MSSVPISVITTRLKQHWIKLGIAALLIAIYGLLGFLWVPKLIKANAAQLVETQLHRKLTLGEVAFNPFTLTLHVQNIKLAEKNNAPIASIHDLLINAELSSLWHRAYVFKEVRIETPTINAIIDSKGQLNLAAIKPNPSVTTPANTNNELPRIHIGLFELLAGELHYKDFSRPKPFDAQLKPITFTLHNFRTDGTHENAFHFAAKSDENESLDWAGDFTVQPFSAAGSLKIAKLNATTIQSYLQDKLPFVLGSGKIDLTGTYKLVTSNQFDVLLSLSNVHVSDMHVQPLGATDQPWLVLPQINVTDTIISLHDRSASIKAINIDDADITAWLDEHHQLNLMQLLDTKQDTTPDTKKDSNETKSAKWLTHIAAINLNRATIHAEDRSVNPAAQFTLAPVNVHLQNLSTAPAAQMNIDVQVGISGGNVTAKGESQLDTLNTNLQLQVSNFALNSLQNYLAQSTDIIIHGGAFNTKGSFTYKGSATSKEPMLQYAGSVEVDDLDTEDKATSSAFVKWKQLQLNKFRYAMSPDQLSIDKIVARGLYGRLAINQDFTTNIQRALRLPTSKTKNDHVAVAALAPSKPTSPAMKVQIAKVVIEDGTADFSDESIQPNFTAGIENLNGTITGLSTNDTSRATVKLQGSMDNYAPVDINGEINFLAASTYSDLSLNFSNIDLTAFNPYSGKFAGYNIDKGKLSTQLRYKIVDRKLDAQHHIVIDQLEFGKATDSKDAVSLPVKLAVALLKNRDGVIEIDLPISGSLDDPEFHAGPLVWQAFKTLLTKIVTSPFAALGSMFGGGPEMSYIDFAPDSALLPDTAKDKLDKLSHALVERPQLKLDIPLTTVGNADNKAMTQLALDQAIKKYLSGNASATPQQRLDALTALYRDKTGNEPVFDNLDDKNNEAVEKRVNAMQQQLLPKFAVTDEQRNALAAQRAAAVQAELLTNTALTPERIFKVGIERNTKSPPGVVRMELKLE